MAFDFPNSPSEGTVYGPPGGPIYVYTGGVWRMQGSGQVVTAEARNRIVNGAMQISQENGNTGGTANGYYPADQWLSGFASSSVITAQRGVGVTGAPAQPFIALFAAPAETAAAAAEYIAFTHRTEGIRVSDFNFGTASSMQAVIAFDVSVPVAGTYWVSIANATNTHSFLASYTISAGEVATWVRKSVIVPAGAINAGTWATDTTNGATLRFTLHAGTTFTGVAGFQSGNFYAGPGQALGLSTAGGCYLTRVGLYLDPNATGVPPPWQMPDEAQELLACMRYWQTTTCHLDGNVTTGLGYNAAGLVAVPPRVVPTLTGVNMTVQAFPAALGLSYASPNMVYDTHTCNLTARGIIRTIVYANARM